MCFIVSVLVVQNYAFCSPVWVLMISESPGSVTVKQPTRKYLPEMFQSISSLRTILAVSGSSPVKILTAGSSQFDVITLVVVDTGLGQHGVILDLRLPEIDKKKHLLQFKNYHLLDLSS